MMKADRPSSKERAASELRLSVADDSIRSAFDPVIEGSTFQILAEGLDPSTFNQPRGSELEIPEVLATFDLAESLSLIPEKLFFRIGEVAELLDVRTYVLRFWETEFPMVSPSKSRAGQRVYRKKDVEMLLLIKHLLYVERFSIEGARKRIRELRGSSTSRSGAKDKSLALPTGDRESLNRVLTELQDLAQPELSKFFRF